MKDKPQTYCMHKSFFKFHSVRIKIFQSKGLSGLASLGECPHPTPSSTQSQWFITVMLMAQFEWCWHIGDTTNSVTNILNLSPKHSIFNIPDVTSVSNIDQSKNSGYLIFVSFDEPIVRWLCQKNLEPQKWG